MKSNNSSVNLCFGRSICRYTPCMSKLYTFIYSYASITMIDNMPSRVIVGDFDYSIDTNLRCGYPFTHILTLNLPLLFSFIRLTALSAFCF